MEEAENNGRDTPAHGSAEEENGEQEAGEEEEAGGEEEQEEEDGDEDEEAEAPTGKQVGLAMGRMVTVAPRRLTGMT